MGRNGASKLSLRTFSFPSGLFHEKFARISHTHMSVGRSNLLDFMDSSTVLYAAFRPLPDRRCLADGKKGLSNDKTAREKGGEKTLQNDRRDKTEAERETVTVILWVLFT